MRNVILLSVALLSLIFVLPVLAMSGQPLYTPPVMDEQSADTTPSPTPYKTPAPTPKAQPAPTPQEPPPSDRDVPVTVLVSGEIQEMSLRDYLFGVTAAEIPGNFPPETVKAQIVAARTFAYYTMNENPSPAHEGADLCDSSGHCQAYLSVASVQERWGADADAFTEVWQTALEETDGEIVVFDQEPILAVFHDSSSGKTERAADVWGEDYPYLQSVDSPDETAAPRYFGEVVVSAETFWQIIRAAHPDAQSGGAVFTDFVYTGTGAVHSVKVGGAVCTGTELRSLFGLRSAHFTVSVREGKVFFNTEGYGHGVGLSQYGARALALEGKTYREILAWYYQNTEVGRYNGLAREVFLGN